MYKVELWRGWSNRIGWYEGFHLLLCVNPLGVITGFGFGAASSQSSLILGTDTDYVPGFSSTYRKFHIGLTTSTHDQQLASTLFAARQTPSPRLPSAVLPAHGSYVADKGFAGERPRQRWQQQYQLNVVTPPHQTGKRIRWPKALRRWLASIRQIIETVNDKLLNTLRLARERPHDLTSFQARWAAKVSLHNFCIWLNLHLGRAPLAFADLLD